MAQGRQSYEKANRVRRFRGCRRILDKGEVHAPGGSQQIRQSNYLADEFQCRSWNWHCVERADQTVGGRLCVSLRAAGYRENDETRMTNDEEASPRSFVIWPFVIRWSFVIRHLI